MGTHISPLHTRQHQSALAQWEMVLGEPDARLHGSVQSYQGYVERTPGFARRLETPSSDIVLIISLGPGLHVINPRNPARATDTHSTFIAGLHDSYMLTQSCGEWQGIQVNFTPIGAHLCFGVPMHEFTNRVVDLEDLFGTRAHRLMRQLYEGPELGSPFCRSRYDPRGMSGNCSYSFSRSRLVLAQVAGSERSPQSQSARRRTWMEPEAFDRSVP